jgi:hypothetical protein
MSLSTSLLAVLAMCELAFAQNTTSTNATAAAAAAAGAARKAAQEKADFYNTEFYNFIWVICSGMIVLILLWRLSQESIKHLRLISCLGNGSQRYFALPSRSWAIFKKHILYAPIGSKRHNREYQLSTVINVGTLPTRFQFAFIVGYFGTNVAFCTVGIPWSAPFASSGGQLVSRTGLLAVANMVPLFVMAGRNNPLINWLNCSFDTFNLLHRWFGRIVVLEALAHTLTWIAIKVQKAGWAAVSEEFKEGFFYFGLLAVCAFVALALQGTSALRHAFYEFFKYLHITLAAVAIVGVYYHLKIGGFPELPLIFVVIAIWVAERSTRGLRLWWRNRSGSRTLVESLPGNAVRVTVEMKRPWQFKAGQHCYIYMPSVEFMTSHPFSVAWSEEAQDLSEEKIAMNRQEILSSQKTTVSLIIRGRTGFTQKLCKRAENSPDGKFYTKAFTEGPYGGMHSMHSYGTVMLFAGGVGIAHAVPHVRDLVAGHANGTVAARRIVLIWIIQSPEHLEWIRPWMTSILAMEKRRDCLRIMLFVSRPRSTKEIHSPSATVQMFPGRPNITTLIDLEIENQVGAMAVSVCGSGSLSDDVRSAIRSRQHVSSIDFIEEAFSW